MNEIFRTNRFSIEVLAKGGFLDHDDGYGDTTYKVVTYTLRLNHVALDAYWKSIATKDGLDFEEHQKYLDYLAEKDVAKVVFENKIAELLDVNPDHEKQSFAIRQVVSEIFTAVTMQTVQ